MQANEHLQHVKLYLLFEKDRDSLCLNFYFIFPFYRTFILTASINLGQSGTISDRDMRLRMS